MLQEGRTLNRLGGLKKSILLLHSKRKGKKGGPKIELLKRDKGKIAGVKRKLTDSCKKRKVGGRLGGASRMFR